VLTFYQVPWERGAPMDFGPYIEAMLRLCELQQLDSRPIEHLRRIKAVVDELRGPVALSELKKGEENAVEYEQWLVSSFPEAFDQMRKQAAERAQRHALN
jgi:hypothetical protein